MNLNIINLEKEKYNKLKNHFQVFFKILNKNIYKLNENQRNNLIIKLNNMNEKIDILYNSIDDILLELKDNNCDMDENIIIELNETENVNKLVKDLMPFFLAYQISQSNP